MLDNTLSFAEHSAVADAVTAPFLCNAAHAVNPVNTLAANGVSHRSYPPFYYLYSVQWCVSAFRTRGVGNVAKDFTHFHVAALGAFEIIAHNFSS